VVSNSPTLKLQSAESSNGGLFSMNVFSASRSLLVRAIKSGNGASAEQQAHRPQNEREM